MIDLKDYSPKEVQFKLPTTVKFPEIIFPDCVCMDEIKKETGGELYCHSGKRCNSQSGDG